jgi:hypothetical protein
MLIGRSVGRDREGFFGGRREGFFHVFLHLKTKWERDGEARSFGHFLRGLLDKVVCES